SPAPPPYNSAMELAPTIREARAALAAGKVDPTALARAALDCANRNTGQNTYLWRDPEWTITEAAHAAAMPAAKGGLFGDGRPNLWGIPVSIKDCFDIAGSPTTCGVSFYRDRNGLAPRDSWLVEKLREAGAV